MFIELGGLACYWVDRLFLTGKNLGGGFDDVGDKPSKGKDQGSAVGCRWTTSWPRRPTHIPLNICASTVEAVKNFSFLRLPYLDLQHYLHHHTSTPAAPPCWDVWSGPTSLLPSSLRSIGAPQRASWPPASPYGLETPEWPTRNNYKLFAPLHMDNLICPNRTVSLLQTEQHSHFKLLITDICLMHKRTVCS